MLFQNELKEIREKLLKDHSFSNISKEKKEEIMKKSKEIFLKRIFLKLMEKLEYRDRERVQAMIENEVGPGEMESFFKSRISEYDEIVKKMADNFIQDMRREI